MAYESTGPDIKTSETASNPGDSPGVARNFEQAASKIARTAGRTAEQARNRTAAGLESAAKSVHSGVDRMATAGHGAGDALASSARYVREHDVRDMTDDVMSMVRNNPGVALLGAAALGFLIGRAVTRY
jgi:hypothetical protein